jgi:hypothetical protein
MKRIFLLWLLIIIFAANLKAQEADEPVVRLSFFAETGYNTFKLNEVADTYNAIIDEFANYNISLRNDDMFSGNIVYGGGLYFSGESGIKIKVGVNLSGTDANSKYYDSDGTLTIGCEVDAFNFYLGLQKEIAKWGAVNPIVDFNLVLGSSDCAYTSKIVLRDGATQTAEEEFSAQSLYFQPALGLVYAYSPIEITLRAGYKMLAVKNIDSDSSSLPVIDMGGFFIITGISFTVPND